MAAFRKDKDSLELKIVEFPNAKHGQVPQTIRLTKPLALTIEASEWDPGLPWAPRPDTPVAPQTKAAPASPVKAPGLK